MGITQESAVESNIEAHLLSDGWHQLEPAAYDRKMGVFSEEVIAFVKASQPKAWPQFVTRHGGEATAREKFLKVVGAALDHRGTISVLRLPVKDSGVSVRLCFFKPASGLNAEQTQRYEPTPTGSGCSSTDGCCCWNCHRGRTAPCRRSPSRAADPPLDRRHLGSGDRARRLGRARRGTPGCG